MWVSISLFSKCPKVCFQVAVLSSGCSNYTGANDVVFRGITDSWTIYCQFKISTVSHFKYNVAHIICIFFVIFCQFILVNSLFLIIFQKSEVMTWCPWLWLDTNSTWLRLVKEVCMQTLVSWGTVLCTSTPTKFLEDKAIKNMTLNLQQSTALTYRHLLS